MSNMTITNGRLRMQHVLMLALVLCVCALPVIGQNSDTAQVKGEYPYLLPILGKKAHDRGYRLQLPHGLSIGTIFTRQSLVLENFRFAFARGDELPDFEKYDPLAELIQFGPSEGRINTLNFRFDTWLLPFLSVGGYYGEVWGEQTITLTQPVELSSTTDIIGRYYGFNVLAVAPAGPVVLSTDYSLSWTTNERLDKPVQVHVAGIRVIKRFMSKKRPDRFVAVWAGTQFQRLASRTSGNIPLGEALDIDEGTLDEWDKQWEEYKMTPEWEELPPADKIKLEATYQLVREAVLNVAETTVYYQFDKRLEKKWNLVFGANWQISNRWQIRGEYGVLKGKQQLMLMGTYRFGI